MICVSHLITVPHLWCQRNTNRMTGEDFSRKYSTTKTHLRSPPMIVRHPTDCRHLFASCTCWWYEDASTLWYPLPSWYDLKTTHISTSLLFRIFDIAFHKRPVSSESHIAVSIFKILYPIIPQFLVANLPRIPHPNYVVWNYFCVYPLSIASNRPQRLLVYINPVSGAGKAGDIYHKHVAPVFELAGVVTEVLGEKKTNLFLKHFSNY